MCKRQGSLTGLASPNTDSSDDKPQETWGVGLAQNIKASYALAAKLPLAIRRHAHLMGISLPMPAFGSLRSQHDEIMTKAACRQIMISGMPPF